MPWTRPHRRLAMLLVAPFGTAALLAASAAPAQQPERARTTAPRATARQATVPQVKPPAAAKAKPPARRASPPRRAAPARRPVPARGATAPAPAVAAAPVLPAPELVPLLALDSAFGPADAPARIPLARHPASGDSVFLHLVGRGRDPSADGWAAVSVLHAALRKRVRTATEGAAFMLGPQDPWQLGGATETVALDLHALAGEILPLVRRALSALDEPVDSATVARTAEGLARDVEQRTADATARGFAAIAARLDGRPAPSPAELAAALRAVRHADVATRHAAWRRGVRWHAGAVAAPGSDVPVTALSAALGPAPSPPVGTTGAAAPSPPAAVTTPGRVRVAAPEAGWSFAGFALRVPLAPDDSDWVALRVAALALGGVPGANRFDASRDASTLGGGATLDGTPGHRAAEFTAWSATTGDPAAALRGWRSRLEEARRGGFTDAEVAAAARFWLGARAASRDRPVVLARVLAERASDGRRFAAWDAALERRARALTGAVVTAAFRLHVEPARLVEVVAGPSTP